MKTTWQLQGLQPYISVAYQWWTREQRPELGLFTALALCKKHVGPGVTLFQSVIFIAIMNS